MSGTERDNVRRWDGRSTGHYEVWYATFNHRPSQTGYWIRYTLESPVRGGGDAYAQLWFARFDARDPTRTFAINRKFPIDLMSAASNPFAVTIGDACITHAGATGQLVGDGHQVKWDLSWLPSRTTHHQLPRIMYQRGGLGDTTVLTPNLDIPISGRIEVDGEVFELDHEPGGQTHLWGKKHAHAWAWGHCNAFEGRPGAALETLSVTLRKRGYTLPRMTILCLYLDGEAYRFREFHHTLLTGAEFGTGSYRFRARGARVRLEGEFTCRPDDMVVATYEDPDGELSYCANTEVADLRVTVFKRSGLLGRFREYDQLVAPRSGHFEVGSRQRDLAVTKDHVTVQD